MHHFIRGDMISDRYLIWILFLVPSVDFFGSSRGLPRGPGTILSRMAAVLCVHKKYQISHPFDILELHISHSLLHH